MVKQKIIFALFFTISLTSAVSQQSVNKYDENGKKDGVWQKKYQNTDQLRYRGVFKNGKEVDTFKYYKLKNRKSVLSAVKVFNEIDSIAEVIFYASNRKIVSKGRMNGKKFIDTWTYYHKNSDNVMILENYNSKGLLHGERNVYFINGVIAEKAQYDNGVLSGTSKWFSESNRLLQESKYLKNKLNGKSKYYDNAGKIKAEGDYKQDIKVGVWLYYNNGEIVRKVNHDTQEVLFKKQ